MVITKIRLSTVAELPSRLVVVRLLNGGVAYHQNIMSITVNPEAQDALFQKDTAERPSLPPNLTRAALRLEFPPSYVLVGVYRFFTDKNLYGPAWDKCKHGTRRGAIVGTIWACFRLF
jgi:hypothetical protein